MTRFGAKIQIILHNVFFFSKRKTKNSSNGDQSTPGKVFPVTRDKKLSMYIDQLHFDEFFQKKVFHCNIDQHTGRKVSKFE